MERREIFDWIFIILILIIGIYLIWFTRSETNKCTRNPITYGIKQLEKSNDATISCSCLAHGEKINGFTFLINSTTMTENNHFEIPNLKP